MQRAGDIARQASTTYWLYGWLALALALAVSTLNHPLDTTARIFGQDFVAGLDANVSIIYFTLPVTVMSLVSVIVHYTVKAVSWGVVERIVRVSGAALPSTAETVLSKNFTAAVIVSLLTGFGSFFYWTYPA